MSFMPEIYRDVIIEFFYTDELLVYSSCDYPPGKGVIQCVPCNTKLEAFNDMKKLLDYIHQGEQDVINRHK